MKVCSFEIHRDDRGSLIAWENDKNIPFKTKRVFCIYAADKDRGFHAHKTEREVIVCLMGSCTVVLDDGNEETSHCLDNPDKGLFVGRQTWLQLHDFAEGTILLVLSDSLYNEDDYIRNYDEFIEGLRSI